MKKKITTIILITLTILTLTQQFFIFNMNQQIKEIKAKQVDDFVTIQQELSYHQKGSNYAD